MSKPQDKKRQQVKLARLEIVATLYKRGYSIRKIQSEVMKRLALKTYSIATCHSDIQSLLEEWRENRIEDMDAALQLELNALTTPSGNCGNSGRSQRRTTRKQPGSRKALLPVTTKQGRPPYAPIRQSGRKRR